MEYLIENELVDTYGGDFTYRDVWFEIEDGKKVFYEKYIGAKATDVQEIEDQNEIAELISDFKLKEELDNDEEVTQILSDLNKL